MESGFRTPLLDFFRRGEVARDVRLVAAQGALAPRAHEQLGLLVFLLSDTDPEIASTAESTLQAIPTEALSAFLARSDTPALKPRCRKLDVTSGGLKVSRLALSMLRGNSATSTET